jgi:hypothetical protein
MSDTLQFILWFFGVPVVLVMLLLAASVTEWAVWHLGNAAARCNDRLSGWRITAAQQSNRQESHREFMNWLDSQAGTAESGSDANETLVEAQRQSDLIRILIEDEVPKAVRRCVETHRLLAAVTGVFHMSEIAYDPECYQLRIATVWLLTHTVNFLQQYPLRMEDQRLVHNSIVLRKRALPTCRRCPYIQVPVDQAPPLCPTAELVQVKGAKNEAII